MTSIFEDYKPGQLFAALEKAPESGNIPQQLEEPIQGSDDDAESVDSGVAELLSNKYLKRTYLGSDSSDNSSDTESELEQDEHDLDEGDDELLDDVDDVMDDDENDDENDDEEEEEENDFDDLDAGNQTESDEEQVDVEVTTKSVKSQSQVKKQGKKLSKQDTQQKASSVTPAEESAEESEDESEDESEQEQEISANNTDDIINNDTSDEENDSALRDAFSRGEEAAKSLSVIASSVPEVGTRQQVLTDRKSTNSTVDDATKAAAAENESLRKALHAREALGRTIFLGNIDINATIRQVANWLRDGMTAAISDAGHDLAEFKKQALDELKESSKTTESGENADSTQATKSRPKAIPGSGGFVESIRFRSVSLASVPIASGGNHKVMRKAAFIQRNFDQRTVQPPKGHKKTEDQDMQPKSSTPLGTRQTMNAYAVLVSTKYLGPALALNGTVFMNRHIRVDIAAPASAQRRNEKVVGGAKPDTGVYKRSIFLGNLPFDASEEDIWKLFSSKITGGDSSIENVRLVRDRATNLGKGIGYVLLRDRTYVAEALGADGCELNGRAIRVTRCADTSKGKVDSKNQIKFDKKAKLQQNKTPKHNHEKPKDGKRKPRAAPSNINGPNRRMRREAKRNGTEVSTNHKHVENRHKTMGNKRAARQAEESRPSWMGATPGRDTLLTGKVHVTKKRKTDVERAKTEQKQKKQSKQARAARRKQMKPGTVNATDKRRKAGSAASKK